MIGLINIKTSLYTFEEGERDRNVIQQAPHCQTRVSIHSLERHVDCWSECSPLNALPNKEVESACFNRNVVDSSWFRSFSVEPDPPRDAIAMVLHGRRTDTNPLTTRWDEVRGGTHEPQQGRELYHPSRDHAETTTTHPRNGSGVHAPVLHAI